ncbi:MAG: alpha/beta hydrolase-fold protein [Flavobacterium sp.]
MKSIYSLLFFILITFTNCSNNSQPNDPIPKHESFTIQSKHVGEKRTINVWVPESYEKSPDSLPVMYMADGGIKEDFPHIANTLAELIQQKKIKPLILVGIENTERRRDLTGFTEIAKDKEIAPVVGGSGKFREFIREELFPQINKKYRTTNEKSIIGESASGLFVVETFFLNPEMFDNYIAFDPSLWWNDHYLVKTAKEHLAGFPMTEKRIWFACSDTEDIAPFTKELAGIFKTENLPNLQWHFSDEPKEKHATIFRATKEKAIIWTLNKSK